MPAHPVNLGFKFNIRVGDLAAEHFLAHCDRCEAKVRVAPWTLHARFPPQTRIVDASRWWTCRTCGAVGRQSWSVFKAHPPMAPVPPGAALQDAREARLARRRAGGADE